MDQLKKIQNETRAEETKDDRDKEEASHKNLIREDPDAGVIYETTQAATRPKIAKRDLNLPDYSTTVDNTQLEITLIMTETIADLKDTLKKLAADVNKTPQEVQEAYWEQSDLDAALMVAQATIKRLRGIESMPNITRFRYSNKDLNDSNPQVHSTGEDTGKITEKILQVYEIAQASIEDQEQPSLEPHSSEHQLSIMHKLSETVATRDGQLRAAQKNIEAVKAGKDPTASQEPEDHFAKIDFMEITPTTYRWGQWFEEDTTAEEDKAAAVMEELKCWKDQENRHNQPENWYTGEQSPDGPKYENGKTFSAQDQAIQEQIHMAQAIRIATQDRLQEQAKERQAEHQEDANTPDILAGIQESKTWSTEDPPGGATPAHSHP